MTDPIPPASPTYGIDDRPAPAESVALGVQHVAAMLLGNITPPLLITGALDLPVADKALILQAALLMAGVSTLLQSYPIGPIGARLPIMMGTSIAFVGAAIGIGQEWGLATVFGACLVASIVEVVLGIWIVRLRRLFPPLVNGIVVMLIGLTLIPVGMDYAAGGVDAPDYGSPTHLMIAAVVFGVTLLLNRWGRGFLAYASILVGFIAGYAVAWSLGAVNLTPLTEAYWIAVPRPLAFGLEVHWPAVLLMSFIYVISTMETIGDIWGTVAAVDRQPSDRELRGGLIADGVMSGTAALLSAFPNTSYSQNVGLINFTGVASRHITGVAGALLILLGLVPKVGALFATIPPAVIGGGGLIMFAMIFASGLSIVHRGVTMSRRNLVILAVSIGLGLGVELRPEVLQHLQDSVRTFFGSGLVTGGLCALLLNLALPAHEAQQKV